MFEWIENNSDTASLAIVSVVILLVLAIITVLVLYLIYLWLRVRKNTSEQQYQLHVQDERLASGYDETLRDMGKQRRDKGYQGDRLWREARDAELRAKQQAGEREGIQAFPVGDEK
jgi:membrane protein implicated in regulation of membrane protease activity